MSEKNTLDKKRLITTIALIAVILGVILYIIFYSIDQKNYETDELVDFIEYYTSETVLPRNIGEMYAYNGVNEYNDVFISMNVFTDYISSLQDKFNDVKDAEELKKFFSENQNEIKSKTSISNEDDFISLINYINEYNVNKDEFKYAEILSNSSYEARNYYWVKIDLYYGDENPIRFNVGLATKANNKVIVKYEFEDYIKDENIISENIVK